MTTEGPSGIKLTEIRDEFMQFMLRQVNGSAMVCERLAAELREVLMAALVIPVSDERQPAFVRPPASATLMTVTLPVATSFTGFMNVQTPEEFFSKADKFCQINGIPTKDRVRRVVAAALDGSVKLWYRFAGTAPNASWTPGCASPSTSQKCNHHITGTSDPSCGPKLLACQR